MPLEQTPLILIVVANLMVLFIMIAGGVMVMFYLEFVYKKWKQLRKKPQDKPTT